MASIKARRTAGGEKRWDVRYRINGRPVERAFTRAKDAESFKRRVEGDETRGVVVDPRRS